MQTYGTDRSKENELSTHNEHGEKIIARLNNKNEVEFYHFDYDSDVALKIADYFGLFAVIDKEKLIKSLKQGIVVVTLDEFRWMLNAQYELLGKDK